METEVARLSLAGQNIRFEKATLVLFLGWRLVLVGAAVRDTGVETDVPVELTVSGERWLGTVRTSASPEAANGSEPRRRTVMRGVGELERPRDRAS